MKSVGYHPLLQVTEDDIKQAREFYNVNDEIMIRESLESIEAWIKKQDHLFNAYKHLNPNMLERLFLLSRGSVEMTKLKIDKLFTMRGMMPELCLNKSLDEFEELSECLHYVPLPKLNPADRSRVMVTQVISGKWEEFNLLSYMRYCYLIGEYRLHFDYGLSDRYIIDLKNVTTSILTKLNPIVLKKGEILCTEGFGTKIKGIHFLNAPPFVDKFVSLIKQGLKEKVARRLHVHSSYEQLHNDISKEILPKEYGGDGPSCEKLAEQWKDTLRTKEAIKIIEDSNELITDETKRTTEKFNEEYLGMPGSFRTLTEGYGMRIKGIHFISGSKAMDAVVMIFKQVLSAMVAGRISVHKSMDNILEFLDKDLIPMEYGGNERPMLELHKKNLEILTSDSFTAHLREISKAKTNETLRLSDNQNNQYLGLPGSFRALSVD